MDSRLCAVLVAALPVALVAAAAQPGTPTATLVEPAFSCDESVVPNTGPACEGGTVSFTVEMDLPAGLDGASGTWDITASGAYPVDPGWDWEDDQGAWSIRSGALTTTFTATSMRDGVDEPDEQYTVRIDCTTGCTTGTPASHSNWATWVWDQDDSTITVAPVSDMAPEGGQAVFRFTRSVAADFVRVPFRVSGSASWGTDYTIFAQASGYCNDQDDCLLVFQQGEPSVDLVVTVRTDSLDELAESITVELVPLAEAPEEPPYQEYALGSPDAAAVWIDDSIDHTYSVVKHPSYPWETQPYESLLDPIEKRYRFCIESSQPDVPYSIEVPLEYTYTGGAGPADFAEPLPESLTLPPGLPACHYFLPRQDWIHEGVEGVEIAAKAGPDVQSGSSLTFTITDRSPAHITASWLGDAVEGEPLTMRFSMPHPYRKDVSFHYSVLAPSGSTWPGVQGTATIPDGDEYVDVAVPAYDDEAYTDGTQIHVDISRLNTCSYDDACQDASYSGQEPPIPEFLPDEPYTFTELAAKPVAVHIDAGGRVVVLLPGEVRWYRVEESTYGEPRLELDDVAPVTYSGPVESFRAHDHAVILTKDQLHVYVDGQWIQATPPSGCTWQSNQLTWEDFESGQPKGLARPGVSYGSILDTYGDTVAVACRLEGPTDPNNGWTYNYDWEYHVYRIQGSSLEATAIIRAYTPDPSNFNAVYLERNALSILRLQDESTLLASIGTDGGWGCIAPFTVPQAPPATPETVTLSCKNASPRCNVPDCIPLGAGPYDYGACALTRHGVYAGCASYPGTISATGTGSRSFAGGAKAVTYGEALESDDDHIYVLYCNSESSSEHGCAVDVHRRVGGDWIHAATRSLEAFERAAGSSSSTGARSLGLGGGFYRANDYRDFDGDGYSNYAECTYGNYPTNPWDRTDNPDSPNHVQWGGSFPTCPTWIRHHGQLEGQWTARDGNIFVLTYPRDRGGSTINDYGTGIIAFNAYPHDVGLVLDDEAPPPEIAVGAVYDEAGIQVELPWGHWNALPGARNVMSQTYILAENSGGSPGTVSVNFAETRFAGDEADIPIDGNLVYCWREAELGEAPEAPGSLFTCQSETDGDGSISLDVPPGKRLWITYRIQEIPAPMPRGAYGATFSIAAT